MLELRAILDNGLTTQSLSCCRKADPFSARCHHHRDPQKLCSQPVSVSCHAGDKNIPSVCCRQIGVLSLTATEPKLFLLFHHLYMTLILPEVLISSSISLPGPRLFPKLGVLGILRSTQAFDVPTLWLTVLHTFSCVSLSNNFFWSF